MLIQSSGVVCNTTVPDGNCATVGKECWCYGGRGTNGISVCGHPDGYSGKYHNIAFDSSHSPWTIIRAVGKVPSPLCSSDDQKGCSTSCWVNKCESNGCMGTSNACGMTDERKWIYMFPSIVRCTNMEGKNIFFLNQTIDAKINIFIILALLE